jgi:ABC-type transport system involved in cytochrome c biogenesis permease subunit
MVNIGLNSATLLGLMDVIFAVAIFTLTLILLFQNEFARRGSQIGLYIIQTIIVPICLLLAGAIFVFQGWRLDPILTFAVLCLHVIIVFLLLKDFFINFAR